MCVNVEKLCLVKYTLILNQKGEAYLVNHFLHFHTQNDSLAMIRLS